MSSEETRPDALTILSKGQKLSKKVTSSDCDCQLYKYDGTVYEVHSQDGWTRFFQDPDDAVKFLGQRAEVTEQ